MRWQDFIEERREVLGGKPVFKGTRIAVHMILEDRSAGATEDELLRSYPTLKPEHLRAADLYAARLIASDLLGNPHARKRPDADSKDLGG